MKNAISINPLVAHFWATNRDEIVAQSKMHCHAKQVHSVMLLHSSGRTIRLFVALPGNELWHNRPSAFQRGMSVGFHPHHCELTLQTVRGCVWNWTVEPGESHRLTEFAYSSALRGGQGGFKRQGEAWLSTRDFAPLVEGASVYMPAREIHTVSCDADEITAWLVFEGREDDAYESHCFSTSDLERETMAELYHAATEEDVQFLLETAGLI